MRATLASIRLLAADLDGTLVFHHVVRRVDAEILVRWRATNNLPMLAAGRSVRLVQYAVEVARASTSIGLDYDYTVCIMGTIIIDAADQVHRTRTLEADQARAVVWAIGDVTQAPASVFASTLERDYVLDDLVDLSTGQRTPPGRFTAAPLSQVAGLGVTSMLLHIPDVRTSAVLASGLEETVDGISCIHSTGFVDVTAASESKGMSLGRPAELLADQGMGVNKMAAVGDSWNGIPVFEQADIPYAMAGTPDEVVEAVGGRTTPSMAAFIGAPLA